MTAKQIDLDKIVLKKGKHDPPDNGIVDACVMEVVSWVAGEPWSDKPKCASRVIGMFMLSWNDSLPDPDRQRLKPYIPRLVGTAGDREVELQRSWMALDWLVRVQAAAWLKLAKLQEHADAVAALDPITGPEAARKAQPTLRAAREAATAAWAAAGDAAWAAAEAAARDAAGAAAWAAVEAAARDAAWAAAWDVAWDAVEAAARDAAGAAAWAAAKAAAGDAAGKALEPTVKGLQESAFDLLDRMIAASGAPKEPTT